MNALAAVGVIHHGQSRLAQGRWRRDEESDTDGREMLTAERFGRVEMRCAGCGYGVVVVRLPDRCPMCGGCRWQRSGARGSTEMGSPTDGRSGVAPAKLGWTKGERHG